MAKFMKYNITDIPTEILVEEFKRRKQLNLIDNFKLELMEIRQLSKSKNLILAVEYDTTAGGDPDPQYGPWYTLGIIKGKKQIFKDFYYNSGIPYEKFQKFIPSCFSECMESTYEFNPPKGYKKNLRTSLDILKEAGYTLFRNITEECS